MTDDSLKHVARCTTGTSRSARSSPSSAAGRCRWSTPPAWSRSTPPSASRSASSTSATSARRWSRGPGAAAFVNATLQQRPRQDRARQGAVHPVLRRRDRRHRRRPDRLLPRRRARAAGPQRRQHRRGRAPAAAPRRPTASTVTDHHDDYAVLAVQGTEVRRGARRRSACRPATTTCPSSRPSFDGRRRRRVPHRLHRRARLRADRRATTCAGALWDALLAAGEEFGMLPCGLGARDTLRTEMGYPLHGQDITPRRHARPGPARLGGRLEEGRVLGHARRCVAEKEAGPAAAAARPGRRSGAASRGPA